MSARLQVGDEVCRGKYRLIRLLGAGGFAQVYEAENAATRRRVALKVVQGESAGSEVVERLRREAVVSSRVRHRNVVDVYDLEEEEGRWFLVMEYVRGETLRHAIDRTRLPVDVVITLLSDVMRGLAVMHQHGVVHRDIKPENIYLARQHDSTEVVAKLLDFGICKVEQPDQVLPPLTRAGTQGMGTPMYMSPEQYADSAGVDARSDVYSMGVVLYECLTGQPPFEAPSQRDVMLKVLTAPVAPVHERRPELGPELGAIVAKAMARDVAERYASISELVVALAPFAAPCLPEADAVLATRKSQPPSAAATPRKPRNLAAWGLLGALLLMQASAILWAVTALERGESGAALFSPNGNVLAEFLLPSLPSAVRALGLARAPSAAADVPVQVYCEIPGTELYLNGQRIGAVVSGAPIALNLPPGLYRFEALRGGSVVASDLQSLRPGAAAFELHLRPPSEPPAAAAPLMSAVNPAQRGGPALVSTAARSAPPEALASPGAGSLSRDQLSGVIEAHLDALQRCYESALQGQPAPSEPASMELELGIAASGQVTVVRAHDSPLSSLQACFEHEARGWVFPRAAQPTQLRFPLVFRRKESAQLSSAQLSAVVARSKGMLQRCYSTAALGDRVLRLDVELEVLPSGAVSHVEIASAHPELDECISRTLRLWQFPAAAEATRTRFPVLLLPGA